MNNYEVHPSQLKGSISASPSKSQTLRAILFATLAEGKSIISNYLCSPDTEAMIAACRQLGAKIDVSFDTLTIIGTAGQLTTPDDVINSGNSGIVLRFVGGVCALLTDYVILTGDHSIRYNRVVKPFLDGLQGLGVTAISTRSNDRPPLIIKGPLQGGRTTLSGEDSQPVSGLLIGCAFAKNPTEINVVNAGEKPWIDLTLSWFDRLGIAYENNDYSLYRVEGNAKITAFNYRVSTDFSSITYPIVAALITQSELTIENVDMRDQHGDAGVIEALRSMGANIVTDPTALTLTVYPSPDLKAKDIDVNNFVDAITLLAVVACYLPGKTRLFGGAIARCKESNRISAIASELTKMGAIITETDDGLIITGTQLRGARVQTYHDHRIVMSLAVAAIGAQGTTLIEDVSSVNKSYSGFLADLKTLGVRIVNQ